MDFQGSKAREHETPFRWFAAAATTALVNSLQTALAQIDQKCRSGELPREVGETDERQRLRSIAGKWIGVGVAIALGLFVLGRMLKPDRPVTGRSIVSVVVVAGLLAGTGYFIFGRRFGVRRPRWNRRRQMLDELAGQIASLNSGHALPVTADSVGRLPWLATEIDHVSECDLYGAYRGHKLAVLRCAYTVDQSLTKLEDSTGQVASTVMSHVQHEGVRRTEAEAIVFLEPVASLPDVFWSAKTQPLIWYFRRAFKSLELNQAASESHWLATSDAARGREALEAVQSLLASRPDAMLQVIGGYVIAMPQWWDWHQPTMALEADQLRRNLDWACELYESLAERRSPRATAPVARPPTVAPPPSPVGVRSEIARAPVPLPLVEPLPLQEPAAPPRPGRSILAILAGLLCLFVGGVTVAGVLAQATMANNAARWPVAEGRIVKSALVTKGEKVQTYQPAVEYEYVVNGQTHHGKRIAVGSTATSANRAAIEAILAKYPTNQTVRVHHNPRDRNYAVLEPRLQSPGVSLATGIFSGLLAALGMYLLYRGFRGLYRGSRAPQRHA